MNLRGELGLQKCVEVAVSEAKVSTFGFRPWFATAWVLLLAAGTVAILAGQGGATPSAGGDQLWVSRYNDPYNDADRANSVAVSPDGSRVFVTGRSWGGPASLWNYATAAYDASAGAFLWASSFDGPGHGSDSAGSVATSPDGTTVFVTGVTRDTATLSDYTTVAYDTSTGAQLWVAFFRGKNDDSANSVAVSADGTKVLVTGYSQGPTTLDYLTIAYDASTGAPLWTDRLRAGDIPYSVAISLDGSEVFVTGNSDTGVTGSDYLTVAYDASTGTGLWVARYNGRRDGQDYASAVAVSPDGTRVVVSGSSVGPSATFDSVTVAYDSSTGHELWADRSNGPGDGDDGGQDLSISPDGATVFVTGRSWGGTGWYDYVTAAYDAATGARLWGRRYNGPGNRNDVPFSDAVSPDGSEVFVTGLSWGATSRPDYGTVAYEASTGAQLWASRYNGTGRGADLAHALAVSPDGSKVFVTGASLGTTGGDDYATVAYSVI
jgi:hypothetical protein